MPSRQNFADNATLSPTNLLRGHWKRHPAAATPNSDPSSGHFVLMVLLEMIVMIFRPVTPINLSAVSEGKIIF